MEAAVERLAAPVFVVTGLSPLLAPRAWVRLFAKIAAQGEAAAQMVWPGLAQRSLAMAAGERGVARCRVAGAAGVAIGVGIAWLAWSGGQLG